MEDNYYQNIEKDWRKSLPRLTDNELLTIFPEAKQIISEKADEWRQVRDGIVGDIKEKLTKIQDRTSDSLSRWFWWEWVEATDGMKLVEAEDQIGRLKRSLNMSREKRSKGWITDEKIEQATNVPIENIVNQQIRLRKSGKNLVGLCPFQGEKTPSFYIYTETNSFWCFGCSQGGDVINFIRLFHGYSFKEAVEYLTGR